MVGIQGCVRLRIEFLLKTDSGYPRDAEVTLFTLVISFLGVRHDLCR